MIEIIGFEAPCRDSSAVSWGAAAVSADGRIYNSLTGRTVEAHDVEELVRNSQLCPIEKPIRMKDSDRGRRLVVLAIRDGTVAAELVKYDTGKGGTVRNTKRIGAIQYVVYESPEALAQQGKLVVDRIVDRVLADAGTLDVRPLLRVGMALAPHDGFLNAIHVFMVRGGAALAEEFARARLRSGAEDRKFEYLLGALRSLARPPDGNAQPAKPIVDPEEDVDRFYKLEYHGRFVADGGYDLDDASRLFAAFQTMQKKSAPALRKLLPNAKPSKSIHCYESRPGSAKFYFTASLPHLTRREQVTRYIELRLFGDLLSGNLPEGIVPSRQLEQALATARRPVPDAELLHRPLGKLDMIEAYEAPDETDARLSREVRFQAIGLQMGRFQDLQKLELRLSGASKRLTVPADKDGLGGKPTGLNEAAGSAKISLPLHLAFLRRWEPGGRERFFLLGMRRLRPGTVYEISGFPSGVVDGAIVRPAALTAVMDGTMLIFSNGISLAVPAEDVWDDATAYAWLDVLTQAAGEIELEASSDLTCSWIPPARRPRETRLIQQLRALRVAGGTLDIKQLVVRVTGDVGGEVRDNNTRRVIRENADLFVAGETAVSISPKGARFLEVFDRIAEAWASSRR